MSGALSNFNYVLGRGQVFFNAFAPGTTTGQGELYIGNTPSFGFTQAITDLKHYSSESGLNTMDFSVVTKKDISGTFKSDNISVDNLALWFAGSTIAAPQSSATGLSETVSVSPGYSYQIGVTPTNPMGVADLASLTATAIIEIAATGTITATAQVAAADTVTIAGHVITFVTALPVGPQVAIGGNPGGSMTNLTQYINSNSQVIGVSATNVGNVVTLTANAPGLAGNAMALARTSAGLTISGATLAGGSAGTAAPLVVGTDWLVDLNGGRYTILPGGGVVPESTITLTYATLASDSTLVVTDKSAVYGALRFRADNPVGLNTDQFMPIVKLIASGNYELKGDAIQEMTFSFDVLTLGTLNQVYSRQRPAGQ
jgi:hypothetical protein